MNHKTDPWIPILRKNGQQERIAPWQITEPDIVRHEGFTHRCNGDAYPHCPARGFHRKPEVNFTLIISALAIMNKPILFILEFINNFIDVVEQEYLRQQQEIRMTRHKRLVKKTRLQENGETS